MLRDRKPLSVLACAVLTVVALLAPVAPPAAASSFVVTAPRLSHAHRVVALGDSVPYGTACDCAPYPMRVSVWLNRYNRQWTSVRDDARPGFTTAGALAQLRTNASVRTHVAGADIVLVQVGANDVSYSSTCGTSVTCYATALSRIDSRLDAIVAGIVALRGGRPVEIVLLGYWNVWRDGAVAARLGSAYVAASRSLTTSVNTIVRTVAARHRLGYVDTLRVLRGSTDADDTWLLAPDGDHPNATGHARIAAAVDNLLRWSLAP